MSLWTLFFLFMKFGCLCFGGGYVMIPLLYEEFVENRIFFTPETFGNLLSVSQITPGAVSINTATYVGFLQAGLLGAIIASVALVIPTFLFGSIALYAFDKYRSSWFIQGFLKGSSLIAVVMIFYAVILFANMSIINQSMRPLPLNYFEIGIALLAFLLLQNKVSVTKILFFSAILGFIWSYF